MLERLTVAFGDLQVRPKAGEPLVESLEAITRKGIEIIDGAEFAAVSLGRGNKWETVAATGDLPLQVDAIQYKLGTGPCVDAILKQTVFVTDDLEHDPRWPEFGRIAAAETGVRSMLSYRMFLEDSRQLLAGLNFYSRQREGFTLQERTVGLLLATHGALLVTNSQHVGEIANLQLALNSNRDIGAAMGVLMAMHKMTKEQAFQALRLASQDSHRKLRDVAQDVLDTGTLELLSLQRRTAPEAD